MIFHNGAHLEVNSTYCHHVAPPLKPNTWLDALQAAMAVPHIMRTIMTMLLYDMMFLLGTKR
jgi:hypothetical protein